MREGRERGLTIGHEQGVLSALEMVYSLREHYYICQEKTANVSQRVVAKMWLKRNHISGSY